MVQRDVESSYAWSQLHLQKKLRRSQAVGNPLCGSCTLISCEPALSLTLHSSATDLVQEEVRFIADKWMDKLQTGHATVRFKPIDPNTLFVNLRQDDELENVSAASCAQKRGELPGSPLWTS